MLAIKIIAGTVVFAVAFIFLGLAVGRLSEKNHTLYAFLALFAGLGTLLVLTAAYGHAVH